MLTGLFVTIEKIVEQRSTYFNSSNSLKNNSDNFQSDKDDFSMPDDIYHYLLTLLLDLDGVMQSAKYHPERDALYHSLQVFQCAQAEMSDPELLAAALFHDVGKAIDYPNHARVGAELLSGIFSERICWLIEHHLDLLINPKRCRRQYANTPTLADLEKLRRWDLAGRKVDASVISEHEALDILVPYYSDIS